jgi:hypothetical protein
MLKACAKDHELSDLRAVAQVFPGFCSEHSLLRADAATTPLRPRLNTRGHDARFSVTPSQAHALRGPGHRRATRDSWFQRIARTRSVAWSSYPRRAIRACLTSPQPFRFSFAQQPAAPAPTSIAAKPPVLNRANELLPSWFRVRASFANAWKDSTASAFNSTREDLYWLTRFA